MSPSTASVLVSNQCAECCADLAPAFPRRDARVVLGLKLVALTRRDPLFQMQLADLLPCIWCFNGNFLRSFFRWDVRMVLATIHVLLLLNADCCGLLWLFRLSERVVQFSTWSVRASLLRLRFKVNTPELRIVNDVSQG